VLGEGARSAAPFSTQGLADGDSSDMTVVENFVVSGSEWTVMNTGSGNDNLVRRVPMEGLWQTSRLDHDSRGEIKQPHARVGKSDSEPLSHVLRKLQPPIFDQLGDLPALDDAHSDALNGTGVKHLPLLFRKASVSVNPPDPRVGIKQDHRSASQSSSATGSVGRSYVIGTPRRGNPLSG
jgi:hypothetical protein